MTDQDLIQGKWEAVTLTVDGEVIMDADECTYDFNGDKVTCSSRKNTQPSHWQSSASKYRLDATKKPKEICFFDFVNGSPPRTYAYDLQKDELLLCEFWSYAEGVPSEIKSGDGLRLIRLVRTKACVGCDE